ncbi:MAG: YitT family protein [Bilophila sp.]
MKFVKPNRNKLAQSPAWNILLLTIGAVFFSLGAQGVAAHHGFLTGGIFGTGLLAWYSTSLFTPAIWYLLINIPLFVFSWFQIGRQFFFYSLYGSLATTAISALITFQVPIHDNFYASITAGVLCGMGTGIMLRTLGSGGGLDLIGVILNRRWNIGVGRFFTVYNGLMFVAALSTISIDLIIVSFIQVFIASATMEYVLRMGSGRKMVYIVCDRGEEICEAIIAEGYGGATIIKGKGAYSGGDREIILTVTNNILLRRLENLVFDIDEKALFIVENTFYVSGTRYPRKSVI